MGKGATYARTLPARIRKVKVNNGTGKITWLILALASLTEVLRSCVWITLKKKLDELDGHSL